MAFKEVKKDYIKLIDDYGPPVDMTGSFVDAEQMEKVIRNPTKSNAEDYMIAVINYGFQDGTFWNSESKGHLDIEDDIFLEEMYEKYA